MAGKSRRENPVYRCPKGGMHKFRRRGFKDVFLGLALGSETRVRTRTCTKCGMVIGPTGRIRKG